MHDFRRLQVWQRARALAVLVDGLARNFPRGDRGVLAGQLRRAALSIPSNIAECCGKSSQKETVRFLQIAAGSAAEAESHILIAADLHYMPKKAEQSLLAELKSIQRMLQGLINNLSKGGPHSGGWYANPSTAVVVGSTRVLAGVVPRLYRTLGSWPSSSIVL